MVRFVVQATTPDEIVRVLREWRDAALAEGDRQAAAKWRRYLNAQQPQTCGCCDADIATANRECDCAHQLCARCA